MTIAISSPVQPDVEKTKLALLTFNMSQAAGTYDLGTAVGGHILVLQAVPYVTVAAAGLTSVSVQTNDGAPTTILASTLLAVLTPAGKNLTLFSAAFVLGSTKKIQGTIVGAGSGGGSMLIAVRYQPLAAGAVLA